MNSLCAKIPQERVKLEVGDLVRITKGKVCQGVETNYFKRYFGVPSLYSACPQPVCELKDMQERPIEGVLQLRHCQNHSFTPDGV